MFMRTKRLAFFAVSLAVLVPVTASGGSPPPEPPLMDANRPGGIVDLDCRRGTHNLTDFRAYASRVYKRKAISDNARDRMKYMRQCQLSPWGERWAARYQRRYGRERQARQAEARAAAQLAAITPYVCSFGRFAIPCYIVLCETRADPGSWTIMNPIGAIGPYQFLGKRIVWPVRTAADRLAHHQLAKSLWAGGAGRSHWEQCL